MATIPLDRSLDRLAAHPLAGRDPAGTRARIALIERVMERGFTIPGTSRQFGLDAVIGLIPVAGDVITGLVGVWLVVEARNVGASRWLQARMLANVGLDTAVGAVPFVGDVLDFLFKSNTKNLRLLRRHLDRYHPAGAIVDAFPS